MLRQEWHIRHSTLKNTAILGSHPNFLPTAKGSLNQVTSIEMWKEKDAELRNGTLNLSDNYS